MRKPSRVLLCAVLLLAASAIAEVPADALWIDVRTPAEYERGSLARAILIPFDAIETGILALKVARDRPIYLFCAVGGRSETARQRLLAQGYTNVVNAGSLEQARALAAGR
jgi:phage shock protein E